MQWQLQKITQLQLGLPRNLAGLTGCSNSSSTGPSSRHMLQRHKASVHGLPTVSVSEQM